MHATYLLFKQLMDNGLVKWFDIIQWEHCTRNNTVTLFIKVPLTKIIKCITSHEQTMSYASIRNGWPTITDLIQALFLSVTARNWLLRGVINVKS